MCVCVLAVPVCEITPPGTIRVCAEKDVVDAFDLRVKLWRGNYLCLVVAGENRLF